MIKINQLDSSIYNKIAAGEVVERPRSIVKELVENAIDAGANRISIDIFDGGKTSIEISDNGCGINYDYVKTAFLPHATSKINDIDDLNTISTLGFRGEALASIASVSEVDLTTAAVDESLGSHIMIKGGDILTFERAARETGATIKVSNLFYNTPAREKFLKTTRGEEQEITSQVSNLILANPNIAFTYHANGKLIYSSRGTGLFDAIYSIYDKNLIANLIEVNYEKDGVKIVGYISKPEFAKPTRSYQTTIINGRNITNTQVSTAVSQAYGNMLMRRAFAVFILDITMPFDMLDVNVTPSKSDVRFSDNRLVFSRVYSAVSQALEGNAKIFGMNNHDEIQNIPQSQELTRDDNYITASQQSMSKSSFVGANSYQNKPNWEQFDRNRTKSTNIVNDNTAEKQLTSLIDSLQNIKARAQSLSTSSLQGVSEPSDMLLPKARNKEIAGFANDFEATFYDSTDNVSNDNTNDSVINENLITGFANNFEATFCDSTDNVGIYNANDNVGNGIASNNQSFASYESAIDNEQLNIFHGMNSQQNSEQLTIVGQIFDTYLLVSKGEFVYILDQHACNERLIYDKLIKQLEDNALVVQPLLFPQIHTLSPNDCNYILELGEELKELGIEIEEFGANTVKVSQIPVVLQAFNLKNFIDELLENKGKYNAIKLKDILKDKLAMTACKSAIKGGERLNDYEIKSLLNMMNDNMPLQCPHGRPAIIKIERKDIDKIFKRIV